MEFITTGNRIAVENFSIGKVYTIVWATGNYKSLACVGKGSDFVMFQDQAPDLLFCLTMDTAIAVESIDESGGGAGTMNYNELENKPSINGVVLVGNKTGADLNLVSQADLDDYATNASVVAGLATKQDALSSSQLAAVNSGITSALVTQIGTNTSAIAGKQDALSSSQLAAVNSGITSTDVAQITTNKNNISSLYNSGQKNHMTINTASYTASGSNRALKIPVDSISGTIHIYFGEITSTDTDDTTCGVLLVDSNDNTIQTIQFGRGVNKDVSVYVGSTAVASVSIYPATNWANSADDTVSITNGMICSQEAWDATGGSYEPYSMSNADITAWIIAHS